MDFFESQDIARRNTGRLIFLFGLAVAVLIIGTYFGVLIGWYAFFSEEIAADPNRSMTLWNGQVFVLSTALTLATVFGGSYFKTRSLSSGGRAVAESLGGRRVDYNTSDADDRRFLNVVEEMALASGVPVPAMYILEDELGINAFAAGFTINDAAVAVTRGCLNNLTRDELQGVVAHEFAHILNGDMRLNIRLIGVLHGILIVFLTGRILLHAMRGGGSRRGSGVAVIAVIGLILVVVGWFGLLAGRLIKSAVSRQREYLADAAAVQFTRNPDGISGALKKIGGLKNGSKIVASNAEELSHLFFGNFKGGRWRGSWTNNFMSTHPPLDERIRRLEPKFAGDYVKAAPIVHQVERGASEKKPSGHAFGAAMP
ncbi:MAG: M48 family metallopeptidase, partial [Bradymonadaceae bacterium]